MAMQCNILLVRYNVYSRGFQASSTLPQSLCDVFSAILAHFHFVPALFYRNAMLCIALLQNLIANVI